MGYKKIDIEMYDWTVYLFDFSGKKSERERMLKKLKGMVIKGDYSYVKGGVRKKEINGGYGIPRLKKKYSILVIFKCDSNSMRFDILLHELSHIVDHITEYLHLEGTEARAYLTGFIGKKLFPIL